MGTNFATVWQQAIRRLQDCCTTAGLVPDRQEVEAASRCIRPLYGLPQAPKAAWKKVVLQLKVPLQLGAAFTTAAQHGWKSPCVQAAVGMLKSLLTKASGAGITKLNSLNDGSLSSAIREQLQQSGVLQALAVAMEAMAADLRAEAAALAAGGSPAAGVDLGGRVHTLFENIAWLYWQIADLWGCHAEPPSDRIGSWLCDSSTHVLAVVQLYTAQLQYVSAVMQHVLPVVQERAPQEAEELLSRLSAPFSGTMLRLTMTQQCKVLVWALTARGRAASCSHLLRSPGMLQYATTLLFIHAADITQAVATDSHSLVPVRSSNSCPSSSSTSGCNSSSSGAATAELTACQLQLLELLGIAPQVMAWFEAPCSLEDARAEMFPPLSVCGECDNARLDLMEGLCGEAGLVVEQQQWQQLQFEHRIWQLLPSVLLPCARALLASSPHWEPWQGAVLTGPAFCASQLIHLSGGYLHMCANLSVFHRGDLGGDLDLPVAPKLGAWVQEMLCELLQLANLITLLAPAPAETAAAATPSSTGGSSSSRTSQSQEQADLLAHLVSLLSHVVRTSRIQGSERSSGEDGSPEGAAATAAVAVPWMSERFVEVWVAVETALRAISAAQDGGGLVPKAVVRQLRRGLNLGLLHSNGEWHLGRCGPAALAQEQRQYYSALSTVLKLGRCAAAAEPGFGQQLAASCCVFAGQAAVCLLPTALTADQQPQPSAAAVGATQLDAVDYLPSLVLFGRCCLQWAELLRLEGPQLLLLAAGQQQGWEGLLYADSAALVGIPWLRERTGVGCGDKLECLTALLSKWVGDLESQPALDRLAAAGCAPQQLQQQLEALLSAQQGVQQGLFTDASLAALMQQLQAVGAMLTSIAVPHFCNNPACRNVSGPTDVRLVSGRSCVCAGCLTARYCRRDCQRAAWKQHKPVCKTLAAAAAGASEATVAGGS